MPPGKCLRLGRGSAAELAVPWEMHLSRVHAELTADGTYVSVVPRKGITNPVFVVGDPVESGRLQAGESFVVGNTVFSLHDVSINENSPEESLLEEVTFARGQLRQVRFEDADRRIEVLSHLPAVIWGAGSLSERDSRLVALLLAGIRSADAAALVRINSEGAVRVMHWDRRQETAGSFRPSSRLVSEALLKRQQTVLHTWESEHTGDSVFTATADFDWAFCTFVNEDAQGPWGLYVAGRSEPRSLADRISGSLGPPVLQADVKFAELVAEIISAVERVNRVEGDLSVLRQFLSPPILSALDQQGRSFGRNSDLLEPRECDVTVLFCDLRGFSHRAEVAGNDLLGLLDRVSKALEVMSGRVLEHGGVTGDFLGDAVLGFWGWPFASEDAPLNACRAALDILREFTETSRAPGHVLSDFRVGIGIARGRAVAGKIGTSDRVSVTVFGPVVNLASRLETMTKQLRVPILLDEATTEVVRRRMNPRDGRVRRLGRVLPYGLERPLDVHELLPPESERPDLTQAHIVQYERGVEAFIKGDWEEAHRQLHGMPSSDRAQDFLTLRIAEHNRVAPPRWDGVVQLPEK
ncbi:MAG: adenylate/guanylate cyclase domain-containing protein [Planctomycetaceae bacterium]|nr:adenylate/guanylate cyclase domain-containing protein [Planctomycetaceae bacterium]